MSDPDTGLPPVRAIIRIRVPLVTIDHTQLGVMLGYIVMLSAVQILSVISEETAAPGKVPSHVP